MIGIYALFRTEDDKCVYVGESKYIESRILRHKSKKSHLKTKLTYDFYHKVLETFDFYDKENQLNREAYWIDELKPELNYIKGRKCIPTKETREKMRKARLGKHFSPHSSETIRKISEGNKGYIWINNTTQNLRVKYYNVQKYLDEGWKLGMKPRK